MMINAKYLYLLDDRRYDFELLFTNIRVPFCERKQYTCRSKDLLNTIKNPDNFFKTYVSNGKDLVSFKILNIL